MDSINFLQNIVLNDTFNSSYFKKFQKFVTTPEKDFGERIL